MRSQAKGVTFAWCVLLTKEDKQETPESLARCRPRRKGKGYTYEIQKNGVK